MESLKKRPPSAGAKPFGLGTLNNFLSNMKAGISSRYKSMMRIAEIGKRYELSDKNKKRRKIRNKMAYRSRRANQLNR